jgi:hypothetical protein
LQESLQQRNHSDYQVGNPQCEHLACGYERDAHTFDVGDSKGNGFISGSVDDARMLCPQEISLVWNESKFS